MPRSHPGVKSETSSAAKVGFPIPVAFLSERND
jgi:hypothetical protein